MLIIAINAFSQRYETFRDLQYDSFTRAIKKMIQNVKTRWDNTFFMLQRAKFMKKTIHKWLAQTNSKLKILTLFKKKWNQVYYMIELLEFFHNVTRALNTTHDFIILEAWKIYNSLHDHLKKTRSQIRQQFRENSWAVKLHEVILIDTKMLKKYYEATCDKKNTYFNVEALLNLMKKENVYSVSCLDFYCCILSLFFLFFVHRHLLLSLLLLSTFYRCFLSLLFIVAFYRCFLSLFSIANFYRYFLLLSKLIYIYSCSREHRRRRSWIWRSFESSTTIIIYAFSCRITSLVKFSNQIKDKVCSRS